jgi:hypothetical protein
MAAQKRRKSGVITIMQLLNTRQPNAGGLSNPA